MAFSSSHPSLAWLYPDFYDFTVSRKMLKAKDAADVVLMNNFLADFPVEEVKCIVYCIKIVFKICQKNVRTVTFSLDRLGWRSPGGMWGSG